MSNAIAYKQKEALPLIFTLTQNGEPWPIPAGAEFQFYLKARKSDASYLVSKDNDDFTVISQAGGRVSINLTANDLDLDPGEYVGELVINPEVGTIDKSDDLLITIVEAVSD